MKILNFSISVLLSLLLALPCLAQSNPELADTMGFMASQMRTIVVAMRTGIIDDSTKEAANLLSQAITAATEQMPATAPDEASKARYREQMQVLNEKSLELVAAAEDENLELLTRVFREMHAIRSAGHEEFKPD